MDRYNIDSTFKGKVEFGGLNYVTTFTSRR